MLEATKGVGHRECKLFLQDHTAHSMSLLHRPLGATDLVIQALFGRADVKNQAIK